MDNGVFNHKFASKSVGLAQTAINNNFALASTNRYRYSSIEPSSSSASSDISCGSSGSEIRTRNKHDIHANLHRFNLANERDHRWTVHSVENKFGDTKGLRISANISSSVNDANHKYSSSDKAKWTHKSPINANIAV